MKTISLISQWRIANGQLPMAWKRTSPFQVSIQNRQNRASSIAHRKSPIVNGSAFTLVEMLVVISIIGILAALLLPALSAARVEAQKKQARLQISDLVTAIQNYDSSYSRFPVSTAVQQLAGTLGGNFTYGGTIISNYVAAGTLPAADSVYITNNSEVIAILMDITNYPNGSGPTVNVNHQKNPQQTLFLNAQMTENPALPGVGPDLVYRDPWGNPYVITIDLNDDNQCLDPFYSLAKVSGYNQQDQNPGLNGLVSPDTSVPNNFRYHGNVMVWSAGPDGKIDPTSPAAGPNSGVNRDNILSWQ